MLRIPVRKTTSLKKEWVRTKFSSSYVRRSFLDYFTNTHSHKLVKSSSVSPLHDPTIPFVNAGMNQFKGVFLGNANAPCQRAVNSQKCIRVGGKHNDLDVVGTDGHHHTFFEMLGNWSFGDYYKKEACSMAWDLLLGPYKLKPEQLVVTYFGGDAISGLAEDTECRDVWREIGVKNSSIRPLGAADNFWEMGLMGPCGPCTEIHHINKDGSLTEIWNIVFIQYNREADGSIRPLSTQHVDTGMGLERITALLQGQSSNYNTDLFLPIIQAIEKNSKAPKYEGKYGDEAILDSAYRRLADHSRMIAICLADSVFPPSSLNLKQIMRKSFKMSTEIFNNSQLVIQLYDEVAAILGESYPELLTKEKQAKIIINHEQETYLKSLTDSSNKFKELVKQYPEAESLSDLDLHWLDVGYRELKKIMSMQTSNMIPSDFAVTLYNTYGFQWENIERIARINNYTIEKDKYDKKLREYKSERKSTYKGVNDSLGIKFNSAIDNLLKNGSKPTCDDIKYNYKLINNKIVYEQLKTKLLSLLNEDGEWIDVLDPCEDRPYYIVTESTNFYSLESEQSSDSGVILINENVTFNVDSAFKIRDFVFHKGYFKISDLNQNKYVSCLSDVVVEIDAEKRLKTMRNHTGLHLLNAAIKKVLPNTVLVNTSSSVSDGGFNLKLTLYGEKVRQDVILEAQDLVRNAISANVEVKTCIMDSTQVSQSNDIETKPGIPYPDTGLRVVSIEEPLSFKKLCSGTHVPSTGFIDELYITTVKEANSKIPQINAITGDLAREAYEMYYRSAKLAQMVDVIDPDKFEEETIYIKDRLAKLCGTSGRPYGQYAECLKLLEGLQKKAAAYTNSELNSLARQELQEALKEAEMSGRSFAVHFLRCSYLGVGATGRALLRRSRSHAVVLLGCSGGILTAAAYVPEEQQSDKFSAAQWLEVVAPALGAEVMPTTQRKFAEVTPTKASLINCEQIVGDAMHAAIKFAQEHSKPNKMDESQTTSQDSTLHDQHSSRN